MVRMSPYKKRCISRATPGTRLTTARPKATTAENTMPMTVSEERQLRPRGRHDAKPPQQGEKQHGFMLSKGKLTVHGLVPPNAGIYVRAAS